MGVNLNHHARAKNLFWVFLTGIFCSLTLQGLHVYPLQGPNLSAALWESHFRGWFIPPGQVLHWAWNHPRHTKVLPGPSPRPLRHPIAPSPSPLKWPPLRLHPFKHPLPMKGGQGSFPSASAKYKQLDTFLDFASDCGIALEAQHSEFVGFQVVSS